MKVLTIGRDTTNDVVINDRSDVISRRHATLSIKPSGKMTITDQSQNGTYVNGIRISSNVPVPVTRKDNVSFAHVARLDWNQVPNPMSTTKIVCIVLVALCVIVGAIVGIMWYNNNKDKEHQEQMQEVKQEISEQQTIKAQQDSINKAQQDSIDRLNKQNKELEELAEKEKAEKEKAQKKAKNADADKTKTDKNKTNKDGKTKDEEAEPTRYL